jgi:branched-chain amino acid transport system substrate-binding protein
MKVKYIKNNLIIALAILITVSGCAEPKPIKIGFVGSLTGPFAFAGIKGRNGVILAVEQINEQGGINGRQIELIIKDDKGDPETALTVDKELVEEGVVAIIGHITSNESIAAVPYINEEKIVMISSTTATTQLEGIDDYFIKFGASSKITGETLAYAVNEYSEARKLIVAYDLSNKEFTENLYNNFKDAHIRLQGYIYPPVTFTAKEDISYLEIAQEILNTNPEGVVILGGNLQVAMICQQLEKLGSTVPIFSNAPTKEIIRLGGGAVEGLIFSQGFNENSENEKYLWFKEEYFKRFNENPNFAASWSFETAQALFEALKINTNIDELKDTILSIGIYNGLQGDLPLNEFGDVARRPFIIEIVNGDFVTLE